MKNKKTNIWMILFFSLSFICFIGFIIALVMEKNFGTWSGILFGLTALNLCPGLIFLLVAFATTDDKVIRPSTKDAKKEEETEKKE